MAPRRSPAPTSPVRESQPSSPPLIEPITETLVERLATPPPEVPDLLADAVPDIGSAPVISPDSASPQNAPKNLLEDDEAEPNATIRLVGGGGSSGLVEDEIQAPSPVEEAEADDNADTVSVSSTTNTKPDKNKHKKGNSSLTNLKKFGNMGRKKPSSSSSGKADASSG